MTASTMRAAAACALLATTCLVAPACAQSAPPPQAFANVDANGVDLTTGSFNFSITEGSIGDANGGVSLVRSHVGAAGWVDNWSGGVYERSEGGAAVTYVELGDIVDTFTQAGATYQSRKANGARLEATESGGLIYTSADGTVIEYSAASPEGFPLAGRSCRTAEGASCNIPVAVTRPDGMKFTLQWDYAIKCLIGTADPTICDTGIGYARLSSVSSSAGFGFVMSYKTNLQRTGKSNPSSDWSQRTGARFYNGAQANAAPPTSVYAYPAAGVLDLTVAGGRTWRFTTSGSSLIAIRRPGAASDSTTIAYGANGVASVTSDGVTTSYARTVDGANAVVVATDALRNSRTVVSNLATGRPTQVTDALRHSTLFAYDGSGRLTSVVAPEGDSVATTYDARGNVVETRAKPKPGAQPALADIVTTAKFPDACDNAATCNRPVWTRDAADAQTDYAYEPTGQVKSVRAPAPAANAVRPETRFGYARVNDVSLLTGISACQTNASCAGTADETRTTIAYGANLLPTTMSSGAGDGSLTATTTMAYDAVGNVVAVDGPLGGSGDIRRAAYNGAREVVMTSDGAGRAQKTSYGAEGQVVAVQRGIVGDPNSPATSSFEEVDRVDIVYDANGRKVREAASAGGLISGLVDIGYDAAGRVDCTAQRLGETNAFGLPVPACAAGAAGAQGPDRISRRGYDAVGRAETTTVAIGTPAEAVESRAGFTANGKLARLTDGEGNVTTYAYDGHDRLARTIYPSPTKGAGTSNENDDEELAYDARGNVVRRTLRDGQAIGYAHDVLSRVTAKDLPGAEPDVAYGYDLLGRMTAVSTPGHAIGFAYDALGRTLSETGPRGAISSRYDAGGRRTRLTWPDGYFVTYDHLDTGEMTAIREGGAASGLGVLATFAYDRLGRRESLTRGNGTTTGYTYDPSSRLSSLTHDLTNTAHDVTFGFTYNPASQIASRSASNDAYAHAAPVEQTGYGVNGLNQLTMLGGASVTHDARGNLATDGRDRGLSYSSENLLTRYTRLSNGAVGVFGYDPLMRFQDSNPGSASVRSFFYDGHTVVAEYGASGLLGKHVHGPGQDEPLFTLQNNGLRVWYHADERGSVVAVSNVDGTARAVNTYDEYGKTNHGWGRFLYTGQPQLLDGLLYYRARIYDPESGGRFLQPDPIGYGDGMNLYGYVGGDPVNYADPSGLLTAAECAAEREVQNRKGANGYGIVCASRGSDSRWYYLGNGSGYDGGAGSSGLLGGGGNGRGAAPAPAVPEPQTDEGEDIVVTVAKKVAQCAINQFGITGLLDAGTAALGIPQEGSKRFVTPGSSKGTSALSEGLARRFPQRIGDTGIGQALGVNRIWTPRLGQLNRATPVVGRAIGRLIPVVGAILLVKDAVQIGACALRD